MFFDSILNAERPRLTSRGFSATAELLVSAFTRVLNIVSIRSYPIQQIIKVAELPAARLVSLHSACCLLSTNKEWFGEKHFIIKFCHNAT